MSGSNALTELLTALEGKYSNDAIKEMVLRLLQEGRVEFRSDRQLQIVKKAALSAMTQGKISINTDEG